MDPKPPELGSEKFTRWAKAVWPNIVGGFGLVVCGADVFILPPPGINPQTFGGGVLLIGASGFVRLNRAEEKVDREHE